MTTFTTEDRERALPKEGELWRSTDYKPFRIISTYDHEGQAWVRFTDADSQEFNTSIDAFILRYSLSVQIKQIDTGPFFSYNNQMKTGFLIILLVLQTGCAMVYTGATTVSLVTTGKSIPDHAATTATSADCNSIKLLTGEKDYYCEVRDPSKTYNRNRF